MSMNQREYDLQTITDNFRMQYRPELTGTQRNVLRANFFKDLRIVDKMDGDAVKVDTPNASVALHYELLSDRIVGLSNRIAALETAIKDIALKIG